MFTVYILQSLKDGRTYVGQTNNMDDRLLRHNDGQVRATKNRRPLKILFQENFNTRKESMARELWWKSSTGRKKMRELFFK